MEIEISEDGFVAALRALEGGALVEELDRGMIKCVQAIQDFGGKAELTLKVKVNRIPGMATAVTLVADVITKVPKEPRPSSVLFVTKGSGLTDQTQKQEAFDLGEPLARPATPLQPVTRIGASSNDSK